jgi:transcription antitermination factor NusG
MSETKNWYAVYTRANCEKKVAAALCRRDIENYCPLNRIQRKWSDRRKNILEPLFTSCVFVRMNEVEQLLLKKVDGIISMVYWLGKPVIIREVEINAIKSFLNTYVNIKLEKRPINIDNQVRMDDVPLLEIDGKQIGFKSRAMKIFLPSLGYIMQADVENDNVKIILPGTTRNYETLKEQSYSAK